MCVAAHDFCELFPPSYTRISLPSALNHSLDSPFHEGPLSSLQGKIHVPFQFTLLNLSKTEKKICLIIINRMKLALPWSLLFMQKSKASLKFGILILKFS